MRAVVLSGVVLGPLAACGPVSLAQAERECYDRAWRTEKPRGTAVIGANSRGDTIAGLSLDVSSDYLAGRDPEQVYQACVYNRSGGQMPSRPYQDRGNQDPRPFRW